MCSGADYKKREPTANAIDSFFYCTHSFKIPFKADKEAEWERLICIFFTLSVSFNAL